MLLFAALLCAGCVLGCCAVHSLSSPLCVVLCFAVLVRLRCAVRVVRVVAGARCCGVLPCVVLFPLVCCGAVLGLVARGCLLVPCCGALLSVLLCWWCWFVSFPCVYGAVLRCASCCSVPVASALLLVPRAVACPWVLWCLPGLSAVWWCRSGVSWCLAVLCVVLWCPAPCAVSCVAVLPCGVVLVGCAVQLSALLVFVFPFVLFSFAKYPCCFSMGGPAEAPYAPPRVDPGALPFVPMFSESTMLGEQTAPAGSMREGHVTTDPRSLTVQMSHAAQDLPITTTAHAVYAEEEMQSQTMQGRTMGSADGHGRGHPGGNLWAKDPNTGIWTADGASPSRIPNPMGSAPTGPHSMEERDVQGVYSPPPATGGIRLGGVVAGDVGDAIRIDDLRGIKIPYYDGNPSNLDDFILDWEDFAEEVVGEMRGAPRDKWVCRTFPHRLAQDLKEELRDQIREGLIRTEQACLQWLEDEEWVDAQNQTLEDLWSIPLQLDRGELRVREWNRYLRKYRRSLKLTQNQTLGLSCLDGYSKSRPDSVEEHARTAEYRRTLQRLRGVIRTLNRDCTM